MRPTCSLQLLILTFFSLTIISTCQPHPLSPPTTKASIPSASPHNKRNILTHDTANNDAIARRSRSLGFHHHLDIGGGWNMYYSSWSALVLPVQPAAWALATIYSTILDHARGTWLHSPPQHGFSFTYGGIRIIMHCSQQPIPWAVVGNFAERLMEITHAGWTGVYSIMLSHAEMEVSIGVELRVVGLG